MIYRHDGWQSSLSFDDHESAVRMRDLINRLGAAKALEVAKVDHASSTRSMTVAEWLTHHRDHPTGLEKSTLYDYRNFVRKDIAPMLGTIPLAALTHEDIATWVQGMADSGAAGKTIANKHGFLRSALNAAVKAGRIPSNPAVGARLPRTERAEMVFLTREQFALLLNAVTGAVAPARRARLLARLAVRQPHWRPAARQRLP